MQHRQYKARHRAESGASSIHSVSQPNSPKIRFNSTFQEIFQPKFRMVSTPKSDMRPRPVHRNTFYMTVVVKFMSCHQNEGKNHNIQIVNKF